jgi:hypothetical protein
MTDDQKWSLAWSKLAPLKNDPPLNFEESHIREYHAILDLLHEASREDVSHFRIPPEQMQPKLLSFSFGTRRRPGFRRTDPSKLVCDRNYMIRQMESLHQYFSSLRAQEPTAKKYGY